MTLQRDTSSHPINLHIEDVGSVIDLKEVENLQLRTCKELCSLRLNWTSTDDCVERKMRDKAVFEKLQPHDGLEVLHIEKYAGADFPFWMSSLPNLVKLELHRMRFNHLHLDQLQNLVELYLAGVEFEHLHLDQLQNLTEMKLSGVQFGQLQLDRLHNLTRLYLSRVEFEHLHLDQLQNLTEMNLSGVKFGQLQLNRLENLRKLNLYRVQFKHIHLDRLQNLSKLVLSEVEFEQLQLDRLQNLTWLCLFAVKCEHLQLDQLHNLTKLELSTGKFKHLHLDHLHSLRHLSLSKLQVEYVLLNQLQSLKELHLSQIRSSQPTCIECAQPLGNLQRIVMSRIHNHEFKISMQGGETGENLFPGLQHLEMELCNNLRFQPSIPRSTRYIISDGIDIQHWPSVSSGLFPSFERVMGLSTPGSTSRMEIKNIQDTSSQMWENLQHLELLDITELTIDNCEDGCPLLKCILRWKTSLQKLEILNCNNINSLPEWLGEMASLNELILETYGMETLHPCIQRLAALQTLTLSKCTAKLKQRCRESGDDWVNIKHIPNIQITDLHGRKEIISLCATSNIL